MLHKQFQKDMYSQDKVLNNLLFFIETHYEVELFVHLMDIYHIMNPALLHDDSSHNQFYTVLLMLLTNHQEYNIITYTVYIFHLDTFTINNNQNYIPMYNYLLMYH